MKKQITIEGTDYSIDIQRGKELGILEEMLPLITELKVGDVYHIKDWQPIVLQRLYFDKWFFIGVDGLKSFSNFANGATPSDVLTVLNNHNAILVGNINKEVAQLIYKFRQK